MYAGQKVKTTCDVTGSFGYMVKQGTRGIIMRVKPHMNGTDQICHVRFEGFTQMIMLADDLAPIVEYTADDEPKAIADMLGKKPKLDRNGNPKLT